ncbi:hypothetical protein M378DRAFT_75814 [Amanita muscaria Koide BX008]|uniref:Nucleoporin Nup54 alpha-helical domain-containing protein n=1 Tax=Amanita muscaria (strain Koide BX008) TaxID=946122 RepID=A0A0C2TGU0_AMAMK|nr:hypothetical protein M378DRAFT_75814 [Amanita muscaria Koide BX008]
MFGNTQQQQQQQPQQQSAPSLFGGSSGAGGGLFGSSTTNTTTGGAGGGLFGTATGQQQQPAAGGGMFGGGTQPSTTGATSSLFGQQQPQQQQQQQQPSTNLFGSNTTTTQQQQQPSTSLFGNTTTQQQPATGGGLFGNTTQQQPAPGTGLFGSNTTAQPSTTGGLFGSTTQQQQQQQPGGLFGSTTQQQQPSGGLFGSTTQQQQPTTGGLFGSTTQQPGGLFGSTAQQQQQQPATAGGLFGSTTQQQQPSTTGGLFGSTAQQQQPSASGGLFGSTQQQQPATGGGLFGSSTTNGGGLFGSKPATSLFGPTAGTATAPGNIGITTGPFGQPVQQQQQQQQQQPQQQRPGLFGSTTGGTLFGSTGLGTSTLSSSALGRTSSTVAAQHQFDVQLQSQRLLQKLQAIKDGWNPQSPHCRFQYNFYNLVDPNQVHLYGRPQNVLNDATWEKAVRENPDPSCLVPVVAVGFRDLLERVEAQTRQAEQQETQVKDLKKRIEVLNEHHTLSNSPRLLRAAAQQTQITQRLMRFIQHLHLLIPALRSSSITPEEEQLRGKLQDIDEEIKKTRLKAKLNELWALLGATVASRQGGKPVNGSGEWAVVDEEGVAQIAQILAEQQTGLVHLTKILQGMLRDLDTIMGRSRRSSPVNNYDVSSTSALDDRLLNSLRASTFSLS